jgi:predicted DsbA family dithiol-disulfide isomerase
MEGGAGVMSKQVRITAFTDPACTWCWGSEPMLRAVEARYGEQVQIRPVMGGLVKDIRAFMDTANGIGGDAERSNAQIAAHWLEASARHGMPVKTDGFRMFTEQDVSTWPMCEAYEAARLVDEGLASRYLRRLREANAAEALQTNRVEVQAELAAEVGLDVGRFLGALRDGSARAAFQADLAETARNGVRGFPAFLFEGERRMMVPGYLPYEGFREVLGMVSGGKLVETTPPKTIEGIAGFVRRHGRVADREITVTFGLSDPEWAALERGVLGAAGIEVEPAGNGRFFRGRNTSAGTCDTATGTCTI